MVTESRWSTSLLALELALIFLLLPLAAVAGLLEVAPLLAAVLLALYCWITLWRDPSFDRRALWNGGAVRGELRSILAFFAIGGLALGLGVLFFIPERLFELPRSRPVLWLLVMLFYPVLSVYPQELIYRAFFCHRYRRFFGSGWGMIAASATAFGSMHAIFGNWLAVVLTLIGGVVFTWRYLRTGSLAAVSLEHALYGQLIFTIGLGRFFYHDGGSGFLP